jgi:hypothetical protein
MAGNKTPEKPPSKRETSIAGKTLAGSSSKNAKTLAGRVLSEAAAVARSKGKK